MYCVCQRENSQRSLEESRVERKADRTRLGLGKQESSGNKERKNSVRDDGM